MAINLTEYQVTEEQVAVGNQFLKDLQICKSGDEAIAVAVYTLSLLILEFSPSGELGSMVDVVTKCIKLHTGLEK